MGIDICEPNVNFRYSVWVSCGVSFGQKRRAFCVSGNHCFKQRIIGTWRFLRYLTEL